MVIRNRERFDAALAEIDRRNSEDPNLELVAGQTTPKELLYGQRMSETLHAVAPDASEELQLAARCQHICRWQIPRERFAMNREGYKSWRRELMLHHARVAAEVLRSVGYPAEQVQCVEDLLQKKRLKQDSDSQCLEDVVCLVFLRYYFEPFMRSQPAEKRPRIIRRTWALMSPAGHKLALELPLSAEARRMISEALATA